MQIKKIVPILSTGMSPSHRPTDFGHFIGQDGIKKTLATAISSAFKQGRPVGHILFSGPSGYGKTTLAQLVAQGVNSQLHSVTAYAISKPAEMIAVLNGLQGGDVLFIDEIHRLKPAIEEMLYIAMEDCCIDMVMPDASAVKIPLQPFTLIGATTKMQLLSAPLKNRFIYKLHLTDYTSADVCKLIKQTLVQKGISLVDETLIKEISTYCTTTPREIVSTLIQLHDWMIVHAETLVLWKQQREAFLHDARLVSGGLSPLHQHYIAILSATEGRPVGIKTLSAKLGVDEQVIEHDLEPLLFKLGKIEKSSRGRYLTE